MVLWSPVGNNGCDHTRLRTAKQPWTAERASVRAVERVGMGRVRHLADVFYNLVACP